MCVYKSLCVNNDTTHNIDVQKDTEMPKWLADEILAMSPIGPQTEPPGSPTSSDFAFLQTYTVSGKCLKFLFMLRVLAISFSVCLLLSEKKTVFLLINTERSLLYCRLSLWHQRRRL